ncbi:MAG: GIY-YIG nuclease family protein [Niabella sp.]
MKGGFFVMFYVYILYSQKLDRFYVGYTADIEKRLTEHRSGISTYTSKATDWELKYQKGFATRELAMEYEKSIKKKKSRKYIIWLIEQSS